MKPPRAPQMFITSLHMRHWRNFRGPVDVRLRRRAFLIGPNASGKSNVLDALRFLRDTAGHGLKEAVRLRGGMGEIRTLQARTPAGLELAVQVGTDDQPHLWTWPTRESASTRFTFSTPTLRERKSRSAEATRTFGPWSRRADCRLVPFATVSSRPKPVGVESAPPTPTRSFSTSAVAGRRAGRSTPLPVWPARSSDARRARGGERGRRRPWCRSASSKLKG